RLPRAEGRLPHLRPHPGRGLPQAGTAGLLPHDRGRRDRARHDQGREIGVYAIIIGGGKVGYFLSRDLLDRGDEVTLVEKDQTRADWLEGQLGSIVMRG